MNQKSERIKQCNKNNCNKYINNRNKIIYVGNKHGQ